MTENTATADEPPVLLDDPAPHVRRITLNRPRARNALNTALLRQLAAALSDAAADDGVRCLLLTGGPKVFAAGADIHEMAAHDAVSIQQDERPRYWKAVREFPKPVVAAVNGYCLGGGNELAMHADILVAGESARFGQPEINLGIIPGAGGTQRLLHAAGKARTLKMVLTGELVSAAEALAMGLVAEVTPDAETGDRALELARTIAAKAPLAARLAKEAVLKAYEMPLSAALDHERKLFSLLFATEDRREGIRAFTEKRPPVFSGR